MRRAVGVLGTLLLISTTALVGAAVPSAGAVATKTYLVTIGASESLGVQPTADAPHGQPTDAGYANDLAAMEQDRWPGLQLVQFGCPGITTDEAIFGGGRCTFAEGSEVDAAEDFIAAHPGAAFVVTVDLGFNDLRPCIERMVVDQPCVERVLSQLSERVRTIVSGVSSSASGGSLHLIGLLHFDPFVADALKGDPGADFAAASTGVFAAFNRALQDAYQGAGALVAQVPAALDPTVSGQGSTGLRALCSYTWMCAPQPFGPNVHPTSAGYRLIADSIASTLDETFGPLPSATSGDS
jgi:lysophospholipase L1-like esterase